MKKIIFLTLISLVAVIGVSVSEYVINGSFTDVETITVSKTSVNSYTTANGEVKDGGKREINSEFPFTVKKIYVSNGDTVSAGQKIADISYEKIINKFAVASAEFGKNKEYESLIRLVENKPESVEAPIDGVVSGINCLEGNDFPADKAAFIITNTEDHYVRIKLDIDKLNEIYNGQKAYIYQNDNVVKGKVSKIYPIIQNESNENLNTITADITPDEGSTLICGMKAEVKLVNEPYKDIILVPFDAIMYDDDTPYVYINSYGYAVKRYITTGKEFETDAEVVSGLETADKIILNPRQKNIKEGLKVMEF